MCQGCELELDGTSKGILDKLQSYYPNLKRLTLGRLIPMLHESDKFQMPIACTPPGIHTEILELDCRSP